MLSKKITAKRIIQMLALTLSTTRLIPHFLVLIFSSQQSIVRADLDRWSLVILGKKFSSWWIPIFFLMMTFYPEFRNLFYHRVGLFAKAFQFLCWPMSSLYIHTERIGGGLFIQHGFSTIIAAEEIGENCWINQQVTIGYSNATDCPTLGNNVTISAGAKVIGAVMIGENSRVGANAVVVKNVPADVTVVGVPAYIVKRNGKRVHENL